MYDQVWEEMEQTGAIGREGRLQRRLHPESSLDLFAGVEKPANRRVLLFRVPVATLALCPEPAPSRGVELRTSTDDAGSEVLTLRLLDPRFSSIFTLLASDLVGVALAERSDTDAARAFLGRWQHWQQFLQRVGASHLTGEAQRGLFGELWFLRTHLLPRLSPLQAILAWTGPEATEQDFQLMNGAVEVKSSVTRRPQRFTVTSERQLDDTGVALLLLFYLSLDVRRGGVETLPDTVAAVRAALAAYDEALAAFNERLLVAGYLDEHDESYRQTGYSIREEQLFQVRAGFPRLTEADLHAGISNVSYLVEVSACNPFAVDMALLDRALVVS